MSVKLLTEHNLEFLSLKGSCTGSSESTLVKSHIVGYHMSRFRHGLARSKVMRWSSGLNLIV